MPRRSYCRKVWGCMPASWAATEMTYIGASSSAGAAILLTSSRWLAPYRAACARRSARGSSPRSEEHTSELQSRGHLVCRLLLEKNKKNYLASQLFDLCTDKVSSY